MDHAQCRRLGPTQRVGWRAEEAWSLPKQVLILRVLAFSEDGNNNTGPGFIVDGTERHPDLAERKASTVSNWDYGFRTSWSDMVNVAAR